MENKGIKQQSRCLIPLSKQPHLRVIGHAKYFDLNQAFDLKPTQIDGLFLKLNFEKEIVKENEVREWGLQAESYKTVLSNFYNQPYSKLIGGLGIRGESKLKISTISFDYDLFIAAYQAGNDLKALTLANDSTLYRGFNFYEKPAFPAELAIYLEKKRDSYQRDLKRLSLTVKESSKFTVTEHRKAQRFLDELTQVSLA